MVVTYHNIGTESAFNTVSISAFQQQVTYLAEHYDVVDVEKYLHGIRKTGRNIKGQVVITFDDAYCSYKELALPFLKEKNIPGALFVCTGYLGKSNEWDKPEQRFPIMSENDVAELAKEELVTIGGHSVTHRSLSGLSVEEIFEELKGAKEFLEKLVGKEVVYMAYPYGQYNLNVNNMVKEQVRKAGYKAAFSTNFSIDNHAADIYALNRLDITPQDDMNTFKAKLKKYSYNFLKQRLKNIYTSI